MPAITLTADAQEMLLRISESDDATLDLLINRQPMSASRAHSAISLLVRAGIARLTRVNGEVRVLMSRAAGSNPLYRRLADSTAIGSVVDKVTALASRELISISDPVPPTRTDLTAYRAQVDRLSALTVSMIKVFPSSFLKIARIRGYVEFLINRGASVRFVDTVPHRLLLVDDQHAVVSLGSHAEQPAALYTTDPTLCRSFRLLANRVLRESHPAIDPAVGVDGPSLSHLERQVMDLMLAGVTDKSAAERLGITDRTFRRYVTNLMTRLNARSRFEAGARAREHGWI